MNLLCWPYFEDLAWGSIVYLTSCSRLHYTPISLSYIRYLHAWLASINFAVATLCKSACTARSREPIYFWSSCVLLEFRSMRKLEGTSFGPYRSMHGHVLASLIARFIQLPLTRSSIQLFLRLVVHKTHKSLPKPKTTTHVLKGQRWQWLSTSRSWKEGTAPEP